MAARLGADRLSPEERRSLFENLAGLPRDSVVLLTVNGCFVAGGELAEVMFVDGGIMFALKDPPTEPEPGRIG